MRKINESRLGAKMVEHVGRVRGQGEALLGDDATVVKAIAAIASVLALDRPDNLFANMNSIVGSQTRVGQTTSS